MRRLCSAAVFSSPMAVLAADAAKPVVPGAGSLLTTALGLAFILLVIFAAAWAFKRFGGLPAGGRGMVRVLGGASLGARERVLVVQVEDARLVLGVAPGRVEMLHRMPLGEDFDTALEQARDRAGEPGR
jgi:flagellar protein FliO/FliZ